MTQQYVIKTLGCKANLYDSQLIEQELQNQGFVPSSGDASPKLCIVNSCSVTNEADKQSRKMAAKLARDYPEATVVVTGCGAEVDPQAFLNSKGVDLVVGNQNKNQLVELLLKTTTSHILKPEIPQILGTVENYSQILSRHPLDREWPSVSESFSTPPTQIEGYADKTRSFLKIQEGCNSFCTYCIIPYGRGPSRSLRPREIIQQIQKLIEQGVREIILTGTNIGDYGIEWTSPAFSGRLQSELQPAPQHPLSDSPQPQKDLGLGSHAPSLPHGENPELAHLIRMILNQTSLERLRISSLDPVEITPEIRTLMKENPRFCPHFHVSLQSPHSRILRLMKRKYQESDVRACLEAISQIPAPLGGVFVGMDVITGFPGETDEEFEHSYRLLEELPWSRLHVFPYSERQGTPATRLPQSVPQHIRVERCRILTRLSMERLKSSYAKILDQCQKKNLPLTSVLTEKQGSDSWISGFTPNYLKVMIPADSKLHRNQLVRVAPIDLMVDTKSNDVALVAKLLEIEN